MQTINNSNTNRCGIKPSLETSNLTFGPRARHLSLLAIATLGLTLMFNLATAHADPQVFEASGATPADIQTAVDGFRNFGDFGTNNGVGGTFPTWPPRDQLGRGSRRSLRTEPVAGEFLQQQLAARSRILHSRNRLSGKRQLVSIQQTLRSDLEISTLSIPRCLARSVPRGSSPPWIAPSRKLFSSYLELHKRQRSKDSALCSPT